MFAIDWSSSVTCRSRETLFLARNIVPAKVQNPSANFLECSSITCRIFFFFLTSHVSCSADGKKYLQLPYVVKGMDVSFSGLLSFLEVSCLEFTATKYSTYKHTKNLKVVKTYLYYAFLKS